MKKIYLVTGACGHLGNTVVHELLQRGQEVRALVLTGDKTASLKETGAAVFYGDVCDPDSMREFFTLPPECEAVVIHSAGIVSIASRYNPHVHEVNVNGTKNIIKLCLEYRVQRLVHVSSVHAIPERPEGETIREVSGFSPDDVVGLYAKTKSEATQAVLNAVRNDGLNAVVVHPSGISGPGDWGRGHLTQLVIDYMNGGLRACVKGGYDFVDVRDVANGVISAAERGRTGECYILSNRYYSVPQIMEFLHELSGRKRVKTVLPLWLAKGCAPMAELYYKMLRQPPLYTAYSLYTLNTNARFSHEKAEKELGYTTRPIESTLRDTIAWLKLQGRIKEKKKRYAPAAEH